MIGIYIRPDKTQIVRGKKQKNGTIDISIATELDSYWPALMGDGMSEKDATTNLATLFKELKKRTNAKYDDIYVVLPDVACAMVDCVEFISQDNIIENIKERTGKAEEELYILTPIEYIQPPRQPKRTIFAIRRNIVDRLINAARKEQILLTSIEPAILAFFRAYGRWNEDCSVVEMFKDDATVAFYSPLGGFFTKNDSAITENNLSECTVTEANSVIEEIYVRTDFTAAETFEAMRTDVEYIVLTENQKLLAMPAVVHRKPQKEIFLPGIVSTSIPLPNFLQWFIPIGAILPTFKDSSSIYKSKPAFISFADSNLLPAEMRLATKSKQWGEALKKICLGMCVILATLLIAEGAAYIFFSPIEVGSDLRSKHEKAMTDLAAVAQELKTIETARMENLNIPVAYKAILTHRPERCHFSSLKLGGSNPTGKNMLTEFGKIRAVATDEMAFPNFVSGLTEENIFANVKITSISTEANGLRTADIDIGTVKSK